MARKKLEMDNDLHIMILSCSMVTTLLLVAIETLHSVLVEKYQLRIDRSDPFKCLSNDVYTTSDTNRI